jgi:3-dehydroquinate synthase
MSGPSCVRVALGERGYDIVVGDGVLRAAGDHLRPLVRHAPVIVATDRTVADLYLDTLVGALDHAGIAHASIVLPPGEATKSFVEFERLIDAILDLGPERQSMLVALGGGVVGDIVGLAASVVLRGIDYVQVPTTLLAQVDSSVGGKTGIDTRHGKNLVGAFHQPRLVLADTATLDTLDRREVVAGYAEVVKYGLIADRGFFDWLETNGGKVVDGDAEARRHAVMTSCAAKAAIVAEDEREAGRRALLNLGHTFGHALEATAGFSSALLHGEAVALGTVLAFELSAELGLCPAADAGRVRAHFRAIGLPTGLGDLSFDVTDPGALIARMRLDKKVKDGRIRLVLARGIGEAFVADDVDGRRLQGLLEAAIAA